MNIIEQKLAQKFLFPKKAWLEAMFKAGMTQELQILNKLVLEDFQEVIDLTKLKKLALSQEVKMAFLEKPIAVQILQSANIATPRHEQEEDMDGQEDEEEKQPEKKFETRYLDPSLIKEKKKYVKEANRVMKLSLTDGLNKLEAIEYEWLKDMEYFGIGQKLLIKPECEIRRGILLLKNSNVSYIGQPPPKSGNDKNIIIPGGGSSTTQAKPPKSPPKGNKGGNKASDQESNQQFTFNQFQNQPLESQPKYPSSYQQQNYKPVTTNYQQQQSNDYKPQNFSSGQNYNKTYQPFQNNKQPEQAQQAQKFQPYQQQNNQNKNTMNNQPQSYQNNNNQQISYYQYQGDQKQNQFTKYQEQHYHQPQNNKAQSKQSSVDVDLDLSDLEMALQESSGDDSDKGQKNQIVEKIVPKSNYQHQGGQQQVQQQQSKVNSKVYDYDEYSDICVIEID